MESTTNNNPFCVLQNISSIREKRKLCTETNHCESIEWTMKMKTSLTMERRPASVSLRRASFIFPPSLLLLRIYCLLLAIFFRIHLPTLFPFSISFAVLKSFSWRARATPKNILNKSEYVWKAMLKQCRCLQTTKKYWEYGKRSRNDRNQSTYGTFSLLSSLCTLW